jgi:hypothetical protein
LTHTEYSKATVLERIRTIPRLLLVLWALALVVIPIYQHFEPVGWDSDVLVDAMHSIQAGHEPYVDAINRQQAYHSRAVQHPDDQIPLSYVNSPLTLPLLRVAAVAPFGLVCMLFWLACAAGTLAQLRAGMMACEPEERRCFLYLMPIALYFPGLLAAVTILSGNVAYILYGAMLAAAMRGWRSNRWGWFYTAVLVASCFKSPYLAFALIPALSAPGRWKQSILACAAGLGLFASQALLWPTQFHNYLQVIDLMFRYAHDFGAAPAGMFTEWLVDHNFPYQPAGGIFYVCYAVPLLAALVYLSRRYLNGQMTRERWIPVLLIGVILLNPRLIEYDLFPLGIPTALIAWRFLAAFLPRRRALIAVSIFFIVVNVLAAQSWSMWKYTEAPLMVGSFAAGVITLFHGNALTPAKGKASVDANQPHKRSAMVQA